MARRKHGKKMGACPIVVAAGLALMLGYSIYSAKGIGGFAIPFAKSSGGWLTRVLGSGFSKTPMYAPKVVLKKQMISGAKAGQRMVSGYTYRYR